MNELYTNREKMKRRKKKKAEDEEEIISLGSSYLFVDEKLTIKQRVKKLLGLLDDNVSESEDSMKETTDKSEDPLKRSTSVDDLSSLPDVKTVDPIKTRQTSEESSESPKLVDSHSKLSLLLDSPPRTHDTLSRVTLLEDSPPNYGITPLHMDTPTLPVKNAAEQESIVTSETGSKPFPAGRNKTDSQDSERSVEKQDFGDSKKNPLDSKQKSESQESNTTKKSDSQDSGSGNYRKQKSDSQESNDSFDNPHVVMNKQKFQPQESKLTRRESMGGQSGREILANKWRKSPKPKSISEPKSSQSLDVNLSSK